MKHPRIRVTFTPTLYKNFHDRQSKNLLYKIWQIFLFTLIHVPKHQFANNLVTFFYPQFLLLLSLWRPLIFFCSDHTVECIRLLPSVFFSNIWNAILTPISSLHPVAERNWHRHHARYSTLRRTNLNYILCAEISFPPDAKNSFYPYSIVDFEHRQTQKARIEKYMGSLNHPQPTTPRHHRHHPRAP